MVRQLECENEGALPTLLHASTSLNRNFGTALRDKIKLLTMSKQLLTQSRF